MCRTFWSSRTFQMCISMCINSTNLIAVIYASPKAWQIEFFRRPISPRPPLVVPVRLRGGRLWAFNATAAVLPPYSIQLYRVNKRSAACLLDLAVGSWNSSTPRCQLQIWGGFLADDAWRRARWQQEKCNKRWWGKIVLLPTTNRVMLLLAPGRFSIRCHHSREFECNCNEGNR